MNTGDFIIYKIEPDEHDLNGTVTPDRNSHGRLFLNTTIELNNNAIIFRDPNKKTIKGIFSAAKYFVLQYDNR